MCIGTPVQVIETGEFSALCLGRNGREQVNLMRIGPQPEGTGLLNFLGAAREVISQQGAVIINKALDGVSAIMSGESDVNVDSYFPDISVESSGTTAGG